MKRIKLICSLAAVAVMSVLACRKEITRHSTVADNGKSEAELLGNVNLVASACDRFVYPDTIFFPSSLPEHYIVKPLTLQAGTYGAFPDGLLINPLNGNIDITKSETGLEYLVWFVPKGTTDTCKKFLTVSGIDYTDSIYVLANSGGTAAPVYNANPLTPTDCAGGCEFDDGADDDNGNGIADEPPAGQEVIPQGIAMNKTTGAIDLKKSLLNGALGKSPKNGTFKDFVLNYRIGDKSAKALNHLSFRLYYYKTQAQIPATLKAQLVAKQSEVFHEGEEEEGGHGGSSFEAVGSTTAKQGQGEVKCRPPYIIVTQQ